MEIYDDSEPYHYCVERFDPMEKSQLRIGFGTPKRVVDNEREVNSEFETMASSSKLRSRINLLLKYLAVSFMTNH